MPGFFSRLMSVGANKELKEFQGIVDTINDLGPDFAKMDDTELAGQTAIFRERHDNGESLDSLLPEAFAAMREASSRAIGMRHFDVQLIGGIALHRGMIAEMKTGEGKTLVSTLAGYLNALDGGGVHIVTVNDYLAKRDSEWMGRAYHFMGMDVGLIQNGMKLDEKVPAYKADVTYGTNSEFGFDYLRDNMVTRARQRVQRGHHYAVVDEVDSILIDEARTPLIISGAGTKSAGTYKDFARAVRGLSADVDYEMDEAKHTIAATEEGLAKIEGRLGLDIYGDMGGGLVNHLQQALKAEYMFHRDQQYVVIDGEVKIVDEFTGRIMEGRRYSEGLHQAIEAKEGVGIREENQTLATITLQNYFRLYDKLSGMTGTAMTEDAEFREIYNLPVQAIPPNKPVVRIDHEDKIYRTIEHKFEAVADDVEERNAKGQPCLVGTVSIESSERLSRILDKRGIHHEVLNAKFHAREAQIVAQAGREGAVTIATNMAGRGTDILLGGNPEQLAYDMLIQAGNEPEDITDEMLADALVEARKICSTEHDRVVDAGGLCVIGTERHESRRIDNQLRGRSGRQGDPGETQFYLSLEDDLMRLFAGEDRLQRISDLMIKTEMPDDMPIQAKMVSKSVEGAQRKVEEINFAMRKNVLDYDDVMNEQRKAIYEERNRILDGKDLIANVEDAMERVVSARVGQWCSDEVSSQDWDFEGLDRWLRELTGSDERPHFDEDADIDEVEDGIDEFLMSCYNEKSEALGDKIMHELSAQVMLRVIDTRWMNYLQEMDYLKQGIGLRGFGQRDPLVEYRSEAWAGFNSLIVTMREDFIRTILHIELARVPAEPAPSDDGLANASYSGPADVDGEQADSVTRRASTSNPRTPAGRDSQPSPGKPTTYRKDQNDPYANVGRNDPCPCGSGKKFKNCHGRRS